jgi:hypothetical protein
VSWRPWATPTCGTTARARRHGWRPGYPSRAEADGPYGGVDEGAPETADRPDHHRRGGAIRIPKGKTRSAGYRSRRICRRSSPTVRGDRQGKGLDRRTAERRRRLPKPENRPIRAVIGPIGVFRGGEREVVGRGSLLDVREDQRSMAIAISSLGPPPSLPILALAADLGGRWTPPTEKTSANHRHYRHDRHLDEESAYLSRFFDDDEVPVR